MRPVKLYDLTAITELLENERAADGSMLSDLLGGDQIFHDDEFWRQELMAFDCSYYINYVADLDEEEDDQQPASTYKLSAAALDAIRAGVAQAFGIEAKHLGGPRPVGEFVEKVMDGVMVGGPPAPAAFPARALAFGQPQMVEGRGQWDNARYFAADEDNNN